MSQLTAFATAVQDSHVLQEQLKTAADSDAVVEIAKAAGFELSTEDLASAKEKYERMEKSDEDVDVELSVEQLEQVSGGLSMGERMLMYISRWNTRTFHKPGVLTEGEMTNKRNNFLSRGRW